LAGVTISDVQTIESSITFLGVKSALPPDGALRLLNKRSVKGLPVVFGPKEDLRIVLPKTMLSEGGRD